MKKVRLILLATIIYFCVCMPSFATSDGYIVKFNRNMEEICDLNKFTPVFKDLNIYGCVNKSDLKGLEEYIDKCVENVEMEPVDGVEEKEARGEINLLVTSELPWNHSLVNNEFAWEMGNYGDGAVVCVVDTGCAPHKDLESSVDEGYTYEYIRDVEIDGVQYAEIERKNGSADENGHGTHVCGIIGAKVTTLTNGVSGGMAPKAKIIPLKAQEGKFIEFLKALYDAYEEFECDVINMSWSLSNPSQEGIALLSDAMNFLHENGVILVAAAGNSNDSSISYPAACDNVISVGAVDSNGNRGNWSSGGSCYNRFVDIAAPGVNIGSTYKDGKYQYMSGTSMATPHVVALAALARSVDSDLTPDEFMELLKITATDKGDIGRDDEYGYGIINVEAFMKKLTEGEVYQSSPNYDGEKFKVTIYNNTGKEIQGAKHMLAEKEGKILKSLLETDFSLENGAFAYLDVTEFKDKEIESYLYEEKTMKPLAKKKATTVVQ